jgi:thymidine phosphorylase
MRMHGIAARFGMETRCVVSDGRQPVGRAIGPALEMYDVLAVLRLEADAPTDLRERALTIAAALLELGEAAGPDCGAELARDLLDRGAALRKFEAICRAQGAFREPPRASLQQVIAADQAGQVTAIDNRRIARIAKFAGAPDNPAAGLRLHVRLGDPVERGQPLVTLHSDTQSEIAYAMDYARSVATGIHIDGEQEDEGNDTGLR